MNMPSFERLKQAYLSLSRFRAVRGLREWVRDHFEMRYWPWFDWRPRKYGIETNPRARERELVVSLTSFPARIHVVVYTLRSLLKQSLKPDHLILWLADSEFPGKERDLPVDLLELKSFGLEIRWCPDFKSYKKLVPALQAFPEAILVTADDDWHFPRHWLRTLYQSYLTNVGCIHAAIVHQVRFNASGYPEPYEQWAGWYPSKAPMFRNVLQGGWGVVYPPHSLHPDVVNAKLFSELSPTADDLWFWTMAIRAGTKIQRVQEHRRPLQSNMNPRAMKTPKLWERNVYEGGNTRCLFQLLKAFPEVVETLRAEQGVPD